MFSAGVAAQFLVKNRDFGICYQNSVKFCWFFNHLA